MKEKSILKKILIITLILSLSIVFTGCGKENKKTEKIEKPEKEVTEQAEKVPEPEPEPLPEPEPEPEPEPVPAGTAPYYLVVNCTTNTVTVYTKDESGYYTVPSAVMLCSTGLDSEGMSTPKGEYGLTGNQWEWLRMVDGTYGIYVTQFLGDYLFHSVPYTEYGNHGSLQPGQYEKLGNDASHGCIRLCIRDAKWIYDNIWNIQGVNIIDSPDPGPLGKPSVPSLNSSYPGWDPTDSYPGNPFGN